MHVDLLLVLGSAVVGLLVGMTGMGGGALMTPMLVLLFGVTPSAAISSDLIAALFMKPFGVAIHWNRNTIQRRVVLWLAIGSVPSAFLGTYVMHLMGNSAHAEHDLQVTLGLALIIGAVAMVTRSFVTRRRVVSSKPITLRILPTLGVGLVGGFMVGLTSVGAGSLILVLLLVIYPNFRSDQLVGTDLAQSLPLTLGASAGTLIFGHVAFGLTVSMIIGGVPAVIVGSLISSRTSSPRLRQVIMGVVLLSGLKYLGVPIPALGVVGAFLLAFIIILMTRSWLATRNTPALVAQAALNEEFSGAQ